VLLVIWNATESGSVWDQDKLAVAVKTEVELDIVSKAHEKLRSGFGFRLGESTDAHEGVGARLIAGATSVPSESEVAVWIGTTAKTSSQIGTGLSPKTIVASAVFVSVRIEHGSDDVIVLIKKICSVSVDKLVDQICSNGIRYPFPGMDIGVNEDDGLLGVAFVKGDVSEVSALIGGSERGGGCSIRMGCGNLFHKSVDFFN